MSQNFSCCQYFHPFTNNTNQKQIKTISNVRTNHVIAKSKTISLSTTTTCTCACASPPCFISTSLSTKQFFIPSLPNSFPQHFPTSITPRLPRPRRPRSTTTFTTSPNHKLFTMLNTPPPQNNRGADTGAGPAFGTGTGMGSENGSPSANINNNNNNNMAKNDYTTDLEANQPLLESNSKSKPYSSTSSKPFLSSNKDDHIAFPLLSRVLNQFQSSPERLRIVLQCFSSFVICNCDRINISVAILPMAKYYGWTQTTVGLVQSAFFWGYVLTQVPGGYLADKFGGKHVLAFGVITWSAMTVLTPFAADFSNITILLIARALLGFGEGVAMPAVNNIVSKWVPEQERARSLSLIYSGMYLGSVVGLSLCPTFIVAFGWQSVFYIFGTLGFVWWIVWQITASSMPINSNTIQQNELDYIVQNQPAKIEASAPIPWVDLLTTPATWAIIVAHFCTTWGYFVLLTWLPTYFNQQLGFDLAASSFLSILPWLAMFLSANVGGVIADSLRVRGISTTIVRKTMQSIGMLGPALFLGIVSWTNNPTIAVTSMTAALALGSFTQSGVYSNHQDIGPQYAGILLGISNTAAAIPGIVGVALTGYILDQTGSWSLVFAIAIAFYAFGTIVYNVFATGERIF